ncbi:MAG: hypothetical protein OET63_17760 [Desulfobacterales bacterium]|jgi:hypothetical protein|nr:hypothetical protein [Desulfobacterales bacterium]
MGKQPTDSKNISKEKMAEGFKRALSNYIPVLKNIDDLDEKYPGKYKEEYPEAWNDPLELYGCYLDGLNLSDDQKAKERISINEFISRYSPKWVWENRMRLVAEIIYIRDYF